jgi:hypothetical protein
MRTTRAFIAGLGTSGSLVAAAGCLFLMASALIVFKGWPGGGISNPTGDLFVRDQPAVAFDVPGPVLVARDAGAAAALVNASPTGPVVVAGVPSGGSSGGFGGSLFGGSSGPGRAVPALPARPGGGRPPLGVRAPVALPGLPSPDPVRSGAADAVQTGTSTAGSTVGAAGGAAGGAVGTVSPSLGQSVGSAGKGAGEAVDGAGKAAGGAVGNGAR